MSWKVRRCNGCRKKLLIEDGNAACARCIEIYRRRDEGLCTAQIAHGPGHQSRTFCDHPSGDKHPRRSGRLEHLARYGEFDQLATWYGKKAYSGYFDDPPSTTP